MSLVVVVSVWSCGVDWSWVVSLMLTAERHGQNKLGEPRQRLRASFDAPSLNPSLLPTPRPVYASQEIN